MNSALRCAIASVVLLTVVGVVHAAGESEPAGLRLVHFEQPQRAPAFSAPDLSAVQRSLAHYQGRWVLLNFWATWCPPCLAEMPSMQALYDEFRERGLVVVAVSSDSDGIEVVERFTRRLGVTFPVLLDPDGRVSAAYGARNLPVTFILDRQGRVVAAAQGARDWASEEARSTLRSLLAGD